MPSNVAIVINESDFSTSYSKRTVWLDEFQTMNLKTESNSANDKLFAEISAYGSHHQPGDLPLINFPELSIPYDHPDLDVDLDGYLDAILIAIMRGKSLLTEKVALVRIEVGRPRDGDTSMAEIRITYAGSLGSKNDLTLDSAYSIRMSRQTDKYCVRSIYIDRTEM